MSAGQMSGLVDKNWKKTGLGKYSTEDIVGTLRHYGAQVDEASFKELARTQYPLGIGSEWHADWKGMGQFADFPVLAAQELWTRWEKDRLSPFDLVRPLAHLMMDLDLFLAKKKEAKPEAAFAEMDKLLARAPRKDGAVEEAFSEEFLAALPEEMQETFDQLAEVLATEGQPELARRFAAVEENLIPDRAGVATALVEAALGKKEEAAAQLQTLATDAKRSGVNRLLAVDGLIHLEAPTALAAAEKLLDDGEAAEDHHLAMHVLSRLEELYEKAKDRAALEKLEARAGKIMEAHHKAHPHHAH